MGFFDNIKNSFYEFNRKIAMYLANGGMQEIYKKAFITRQYPIFFIIQAVWCVYVVRHNNKNNRSTTAAKISQLITAFLMTFGSREIMAFVFHEKSPLMARPETALEFLLIWVVMNFVNFIYSIIDFLSILLCPAQCVNQVRILIRLESHLKKTYYIPRKYRLPFILFIINFEFIVERMMSVINNSKKSSLTNFFTMVLTSACIYAYMSSTRNTPLTKYIKRHDQKASAVMLATILAFVAYIRRINEYAKDRCQNCQGGACPYNNNNNNDKKKDDDNYDIKEESSKLYQRVAGLCDSETQTDE